MNKQAKESKKAIYIVLGLVAVLIIYFGFMGGELPSAKQDSGVLSAHFYDANGNPVQGKPIPNALYLVDWQEGSLQYENVVSVSFTATATNTGSQNVRVWIKGTPDTTPSALATMFSAPTSKFTIAPPSGEKIWTSAIEPLSTFGVGTEVFTIKVGGEYEYPESTWTPLSDGVGVVTLDIQADPTGSFTVDVSPTL